MKLVLGDAILSLVFLLTCAVRITMFPSFLFFNLSFYLWCLSEPFWARSLLPEVCLRGPRTRGALYWTHSSPNHTLFLSESTFSIVSLLAGNTVVTNTVLYVCSMCTLSSLHDRSTHQRWTIIGSVPLPRGTKSTAFFFLTPITKTRIHTHPSLPPSPYVPAVTLRCMDMMLLLAEAALLHNGTDGARTTGQLIIVITPQKSSEVGAWIGFICVLTAGF